MKILVVGSKGQVGYELQRSLVLLGDVVAVDRARCDMADAESIRTTVRAERPDVVVNAAAYTAVDKAEQEQELAGRVNGQGPGVLAREAAEQGALLVHYSTDYVFDGEQPQPYKEDAPTNPVSAYGRTKLQGEEAVRAATQSHVILRTSWVYGAYGANFLKTMLRLMREREALNVVSDQVGAPTGAALIADVTAQVVARYIATAGKDFPYGTYHLAAAGEASWHEYACFIAQEARAAGMALKIAPDGIKPIPASEYPLPARRPAFSRLDTSRLRQSFGLALPHWQGGVRQVVQLLASVAAK